MSSRHTQNLSTAVFQSRRSERYTIEVRPGEGGTDAEVFAQELMDAVLAHAQRQDLVATRLPSDGRTILASCVGGKELLSRLVGVHRIQRIPRNDKRGRRHTSTASVALISGGRSQAIDVADNDVRIDVFKGSGPGGQHRNKVATGVRLTHLPTKTVVTVTAGRSQLQNLESAKRELVERLSQRAELEDDARRNDSRRKQITTGERSAKEFTWNTQRGIVRDHESGQCWRLGDFARGRII